MSDSAVGKEDKTKSPQTIAREARDKARSSGLMEHQADIEEARRVGDELLKKNEAEVKRLKKRQKK